MRSRDPQARSRRLAALTENTRASYPLDPAPQRRPGRHRRPPEERGLPDLRRLRRAAADRPPHRGAGDVPLPLRLHRQGGGHRARRHRARRPPSRPASARPSCRSTPASTPRCSARSSRQHGAKVWLVNTGWTGGPYGEGQRMKLAHTRRMVLGGALGRARQGRRPAPTRSSASPFPSTSRASPTPSSTPRAPGATPPPTTPRRRSSPRCSARTSSSTRTRRRQKCGRRARRSKRFARRRAASALRIPPAAAADARDTPAHSRRLTRVAPRASVRLRPTRRWCAGP